MPTGKSWLYAHESERAGRTGVDATRTATFKYDPHRSARHGPSARSLAASAQLVLSRVQRPLPALSHPAPGPPGGWNGEQAETHSVQQATTERDLGQERAERERGSASESARALLAPEANRHCVSWDAPRSLTHTHTRTHTRARTFKSNVQTTPSPSRSFGAWARTQPHRISVHSSQHRLSSAGSRRREREGRRGSGVEKTHLGVHGRVVDKVGQVARRRGVVAQVRRDGLLRLFGKVVPEGFELCARRDALVRSDVLLKGRGEAARTDRRRGRFRRARPGRRTSVTWTLAPRWPGRSGPPCRTAFAAGRPRRKRAFPGSARVRRDETSCRGSERRDAPRSCRRRSCRTVS